MLKKSNNQSMKTESTVHQASEEIAEPTVPGTSMTYIGGRSLRRYIICFTVSMLIMFGVMSAITGIMIPNQIQSFEFAHWFTGADAKVNLTDLSDLKNDVAKGINVTAEQQRLLDTYGKFDASRAKSLSLVTTLGILTTMIITPVIGVLSDRTRSRHGRRNPWILAGSILGAVFIILMRFAPSVAFVALLWTLTQAAVNISLVPINATVADRTMESQRGKISGASGIGMVLGSIIGSVIAGTVFASLGFNFYFVLAIALFVGLYLFVINAKDRSSTDLQVEPFSWGSFFKGFLVPLLDNDFRLVWIARLVLMFGFTTSTTLSFYMIQSYIHPALSSAEATKIAPLIGLVMVPFMLISTLISGPLSDKLGRRKPFVIISSVMMAASMVVPLMWPTLTSLFIQSAIVGVAYGMYLPVDQALFIDVLPDKNAAGRDLAIAGVGTNIGQAIGPILAGQIVALTGGYGMIWVIAAPITLIAAFIILPVKRAR